MAKYAELNKQLVEEGFFGTLKEADLAIRLGDVLVDGGKVIKPSTKIKIDAEIKLKQKCPYVSRGGLKLEKAIKDFKIDVKGKVCLDVGASKGGFTDCLLQAGAKKVYALEKGKNLLGMRLTSDKRVENLEGVDYKDILSLKLPKFDIISVDVSFASLQHIIPILDKLSKDSTKLITLIKPRYETSKPDIENNLIFYDEIINELVSSIKGWHLVDITNSPILGKRKKALEFLALFEKGKVGKDVEMKIKGAIKRGLSLKI
jgi:23S rRNA (cytidine1920-2'-O)/16S rRNA (cytidine1409-2'-O)-methyltransferase